MPHIQRRRTGYKTHKTILWFISILSLSTTSCEWDETVYKDFVTENGETITITQCPGLDETGQPIDGILSYIEYVKIENDKPVTLTCHADACRSEDNCCNMDDSVLRRQFSNGFVHNLCPANYRCSTNYDTKEYYCTTQKESVCDEEETKCGDKCYNLNNDENHCGDCAYVCSPENLDAEYAEGEKRTATVQCLNGQCHANTCQTGYHTEKDKDQIQRCVPDNAENCHGINCNLLAGCQKNNEDNATSETDGHCYCGETNLCKAERCELGYHTYNENGVPCLADTDTVCGPHKINCKDKSLWSDKENKSVGSKYCYKGACAVYSCATNYHFDATNTICEKDDLEHCGSYNNDCNNHNGWLNGDCSDGKCIATECKQGFHLNNSTRTCEINDINHCYSSGNKCEKAEGVSDILCYKINNNDINENPCKISRCAENYHSTYDKDGNITSCAINDHNNCGLQQFTCMTDGVKQAECKHPFLCNSLECEDGYHKYNNGLYTICERDDVINCGSHGNKCNDANSNTLGKPHCIRVENTSEFACQDLCTLDTCGEECIDMKTSLSHCGSCGKDCTKEIPNASVMCQEGNCVLINCILGYHIKDNQCVRDTDTACGVSEVNCISSLQQNNHADAHCINATCTYTCEQGYADCDKATYNGCETYLNDYGLTLDENGNCVCDQNSHLNRCGYIYRDSVLLPLCLKQGNYYKNYAKRSSLDVDDSCSKYGWRAIKFNNSTVYCFDKCTYTKGNKYSSYCTSSVQNARTYVHYGQEHYYDLLSDHWNAELLEWNEENCIKACNTSDGYYFTSNNNRESWGHTCDPKHECDMFDSAEYTGSNKYDSSSHDGKQYIDYGCTY